MTRTGRRLSLRLRIGAGALVIVATALTASGLIVVGVVEREMTSQVDEALRADADFARRAIEGGSGLPTAVGPTDLYVQFVDDGGRVVGAGTAAAGRPSLAAPGQARGSIVTVSDGELGELRVLVTAVPGNPDLRMVLARSSRNVTAVHDTLMDLLRWMVVGGSGLLVVLVWLVVGRSLRPVEQMRRTVERLDDRDMATRVALPGTGDELDRLAGTLNELLGRLEAAVARERRFVADASHDLRTPIAAMRALLETEPADPAVAARTRADALARLDGLQALVRQLLDLAGADAAGTRAAGFRAGADLDAVPATPALAVDLDELVLGQARQLARTTGLHVDTRRVSGGQVAGRDTDLARVVENLAANAVRYAATTVAFGVRHTGDVVELVVDDDGPGIAPEDRDLVFERFRTLDEARTGASGTGLGLAIVAAIVAAHHGSVRIGDAPGGGARFEVRLPAYVAPPPGTEPAVAPGLAPAAGPASVPGADGPG